MELEVGEIVLCTVDRIAGTIVFVKIHINGKEIEGSIIMSEIAPGRIRNIRDYVVPKKTIVCKVLRISGDRIDLSLRRVTLKEQKEIKEQAKQEKSYKSVLKSVLGEKVDKIIEEISKQGKIYDFLQEAKQDSKNIEKLVGKKDSDKIMSIINTQKQKRIIVKKEINLTSPNHNGLELIKEILGKIKDIEISYISAGKYLLKTESSDPKTADNKLKELIADIEKKAKQKGMEFSVKEK